MTPKSKRSDNIAETKALALRVKRWLQVEAIAPATVTRELSGLSPLERAAEVLRYSVARAEYWLSPSGTLRALLRLSIKVSLLIGIPTVIVGPIVMLALKGTAEAAALLADAAAHLAALSFSLIAAVIGFALLTALLRMLVRRK